MSALHRIEFTQVENDSATIVIFAVHPDAHKSPSSNDYLLQMLVSYRNDLREGYDFNFSNLELSKNEMKQAAENFACKNELEKLFVLVRGEERAITEAKFDALSLKEIRHDPPKKDLVRVEKNKKDLGEKLGSNIIRVFKRRENFDAPTIYGVGLSPEPRKFIELADRIIIARKVGKSREYKSYSKSTRSYGFAEITFKVLKTAYFSQLRQGSSFEVANVAFST